MWECDNVVVVKLGKDWAMKMGGVFCLDDGARKKEVEKEGKRGKKYFSF